MGRRPVTERDAPLSDPPRWLQATFVLSARLLRSLGPRRYPMADVIGDILYGVQTPAKRRLCAALHARAAGGLPVAEGRRRARASYRMYARMIVDTIWIHAVPESDMERYGWIENVQRLHDARDSGRGGVLALVHLGSWDAAASFALAEGHPITTVMAPVGPQWVTDLLAWSRRVKQMELFAPTAAARGLLRALRAGRLVALLVDIPEGGPTAVVDFCNGPVRFSVGPSFLARTTGAPILPADCWRDGDRYHVRIHEPFTVPRDADDAEVMARVARALEVQVQLTPEQWYPFNQVYVDSA